MCATVIRHVHLQDGREGCFAADLMLGTAQETLDAVSLYKTGGAMMVTSQGLILTYRDDPSLCGSVIEDTTDNSFLAGILHNSTASFFCVIYLFIFNIYT